jgi:hypothetical protein
MQKIRAHWGITKNYQYLFLLLGIIGLFACGYFISTRIMPSNFEDVAYEYSFIIGGTILLAYLFYRICMWLFPKLQSKWDIHQRWRMVRIFIVFAITGSLSARLSGPFLELLGLDRATTVAWVFWPVRLFIIFPIYQVMLVLTGWLFGEKDFFWWFEKRMLRRFGIHL